MKNIVFGGPSLNKEIKTQFSNFDFKGPAQQGDIYQTAHSSSPTCIILLDGYYKTVPAVWHKEIIYALGKGIIVIGSSSLGALRAVELELYGMRGFGKIFEWYRDGVLNRDPDVAVTHTSEDNDYKTLTIPIVNILSSLTNSKVRNKQSIIEEALTIARSIFFEKRTMNALVATLKSRMVNDEDALVVTEILMNEYYDQKVADSEATLKWVSNNYEQIVSEPACGEKLNETLYWDALVVNDSYITPESTGLLQTKQALLAYQLLENPQDYMRMRERGISMEICLWLASLYGIKADKAKIQNLKKQLLLDLELTESGIYELLKERGLDEDSLGQYLNACAIEQEIKDRAQYRSPMCSFNRYHYSILTFNKKSEQLINAFMQFESILKEETVSAIDEISETVDKFPLETLEVLENYRKEMLIEKNSNTLSIVTRMSKQYIYTFAKLHGRFKFIINNMLSKLFTKNV